MRGTLKPTRARLRMVVGVFSWLVIAFIVFALALASPQNGVVSQTDSIDLMAQFVSIELTPGEVESYKADCANMTAPDGSSLDAKQFIFTIRLSGSSTVSKGGKAVVNLDWRDSSNRSTGGELATASVIQSSDVSLRHDGLYCDGSFPIRLDFVAELSFADGSKENLSTTLKIDKL